MWYVCHIFSQHRSQDGVSQQEETASLSLPQLNRLIEDSFVRDERSTSNPDVTVIPSHHRVTQQILSHWQPFQDLKLMFPDSLWAEQLSIHSQQHIVATVEDSVLRTEMADLEYQEEDDPKSILFFKTMSWLGQIRSHRRDETWSVTTVFGRLSFPPPWELRSQWLWRSRSRLVVAGNFS